MQGLGAFETHMKQRDPSRPKTPNTLFVDMRAKSNTQEHPRHLRKANRKGGDFFGHFLFGIFVFRLGGGLKNWELSHGSW